MRSLKADSDPTRLDDLSDWQSFCLAYYEPIVGAFRFLRPSESEADDLAHSFLLKVSEGRFLKSFRNFQRREAAEGRQARFRSYLYRSLQNHARDDFRRGSGRGKEQPLGAGESSETAAAPDRLLDPDAFYALDILHQAVQALRSHCERAGKPHLWAAFEETFLAEEFRGRRRKTRDELLEVIGRDDAQALDNALTTAKRAFRRLVQEVIPRWPGDEADPSARFADWMEILRRSNASQFDLLHLAYRVAPHLGDASQANSGSMVVGDGGGSVAVPEAPEPVSDDEMSILLGFWLEMPLSRWLEAEEWARSLQSLERPGWNRHDVPRRARPGRPPCLLTFFDPTPEEEEGLKGVDMVERLARLKSAAKQLHRREDHAVPAPFAELIYTAASTLAVVRHRATLHSIGPESLSRNLRWFLGQPWVDGRLRPLFEAGLAALEGTTHVRP